MLIRRQLVRVLCLEDHLEYIVWCYHKVLTCGKHLTFFGGVPIISLVELETTMGFHQVQFIYIYFYRRCFLFIYSLFFVDAAGWLFDIYFCWLCLHCLCDQVAEYLYFASFETNIHVAVEMASIYPA